MFTGIIEDLGTVLVVTPSKLQVRTVLDSVSKGDSVSVNGVCLTVTAVQGSRLSFDYTPETAEHTTLKTIKPGNPVNLERALKADSRLGGHLVTGHVEAPGIISGIIRKGNSFVFSFSAEADVLKYIVPKGSVTIEGISLTVAGRDNGSFSVSVIPLTYEKTNLRSKKIGDPVNIETDIIAKYIENTINLKKKNPITMEFLKENGY